MINTTLCYLEKDGRYLMMHRVKKENDINRDKWVGVGGKFEPGETAEECLIREAREEAGVVLTGYKFHGIVYFYSDKWESEAMYLYTADEWIGETFDKCNEGVFEWIPKEEVYDLPIWEGDKLFFKELEKGSSVFEMILRYKGDILVEYSISYI